MCEDRLPGLPSFELDQDFYDGRHEFNQNLFDGYAAALPYNLYDAQANQIDAGLHFRPVT
jgi:hypothetical protein